MKKWIRLPERVGSTVLRFIAIGRCQRDFQRVVEIVSYNEIQLYSDICEIFEVGVCPSSDNLRLIRRFEKRGAGSSGVRV